MSVSEDLQALYEELKEQRRKFCERRKKAATAHFKKKGERIRIPKGDEELELDKKIKSLGTELRRRQKSKELDDERAAMTKERKELEKLRQELDKREKIIEKKE